MAVIRSGEHSTDGSAYSEISTMEMLFLLIVLVVAMVLFWESIDAPSDEILQKGVPAAVKRNLSVNDTEFGARQFEALVQLYHSTSMPRPVSDSDYCSWDGLVCDNIGYVVSIDWNDRNLEGSLPDVFDDLPRLKRVRFYNNSIYGELPGSLLQLEDLVYLNVGHNFLTGVFPDFSSVSNLKRLVLDRNAFSGTLPTSLCELKSLEVLEVSAITKMSGSIPNCLGSLENLNRFRVTDVGLVGAVPPELCDGRPMNDFSPNEFGCDAIACPAGFYQRGRGHQVSSDEPCKECDVPSNVIGSTTCLWHEAFDRDTVPPTNSPTISPSYRPTSSPTPEPTRRVTDVPTQHPSKSPTRKPTLPATQSPTPNPTSAPTKAPSYLPSTFPSESPTLAPFNTLDPTPSAAWETLKPSSTPSEIASFPTHPPSVQSSVVEVESESNGHLSGATGRYTAVAASLFALVTLFMLFIARRRQGDTAKHIAMEDCGHVALKIDGNASSEPVDVDLFPPNNEPRSSLRRTSSVVDRNNGVVPSTRRVRFALPDPDASSDSKSSSVFRRQTLEGGKFTEESDSWFPWTMTPFFDPVNACTSGCRANYNDDVLSTTSGSTLTGTNSGPSNGQSDSELDSILGIRGRPILEIEESKTGASLSSDDTLLGPKPSSRISLVRNSGSDNESLLYEIDRNFHDLMDDDLGEGMAEL